MTRCATLFAVLAGLPAAAAAQPTIIYSLDWIEVLANSSMPVGNANGVVEPGEGARVRITTTVAPGIGSSVTYTAPPGPGAGTIAGLGAIFFDLLQTNALGGSWSSIERGIWALGHQGSGQADGSLISGLAGQFNAYPMIVNPTNPVSNIWQGTWTPSVYAPRAVSFQSAAPPSGSANHSAIHIEYGRSPENIPLYTGRFVSADWGNTGPIPIIPAPSSLLPLATLFFLPRRRRP